MVEKNKKAQMMHLPFGMIFSMLLIAVFIVVAFFVIRHFINTSKCGQVNIFADSLQEAINKAWNREEYSKTFSSVLPSKIKYVCFYDLNKNKNGEYSGIKLKGDLNNEMFFSPPLSSCDRPSATLNHINITEITKTKNPYCFENTGKISMKIEKGFRDKSVVVK